MDLLAPLQFSLLLLLQSDLIVLYTAVASLICLDGALSVITWCLGGIKIDSWI